MRVTDKTGDRHQRPRGAKGAPWDAGVSPLRRKRSALGRGCQAPVIRCGIAEVEPFFGTVPPLLKNVTFHGIAFEMDSSDVVPATFPTYSYATTQVDAPHNRFPFVDEGVKGLTEKSYRLKM